MICARNAVTASTFEAPLDSAAAMFSCCSMMAAPIAAKPMTMAMVCRCRDERSSRNASAPLTLASSPVLLASLRPAPGSRRTIIATVTVQSARVAALTSSTELVPIRSTTVEVIVAPAKPPRLEPAPMKPKMRLACRGS